MKSKIAIFDTARVCRDTYKSKYDDFTKKHSFQLKEIKEKPGMKPGTLLMNRQTRCEKKKSGEQVNFQISAYIYFGHLWMFQ